MQNRDIDIFFRDCGLTESVQKQVRPPNEMWLLEAGRFPVFIQTQESANRMRVVAFIADIKHLDNAELIKLMEANYHTALDARYAISGENLVSTFIHPFKELDYVQFVLGFYQTISCAETFGISYSGGTMVFGITGGPKADKAEKQIGDLISTIVQKVKGR